MSDSGRDGNMPPMNPQDEIAALRAEVGTLRSRLDAAEKTGAVTTVAVVRTLSTLRSALVLINRTMPVIGGDGRRVVADVDAAFDELSRQVEAASDGG